MSTWSWIPWYNKWKRSNNQSQNHEDLSITQATTTLSVDESANSSDNNIIKIIVDDPAEEDALDFQRYSQNLANIIKATKPKFAVGIFGKWGTGKTTLMRMIKAELDKDPDRILTVWFDAWRYEREKHLAVIPFLRQIRIALENDLAKNRKTSRWDMLRSGLDRTFTAFLESTQLSVSVPGSPVSPTINLETVVNSLQSKGSTYVDNERIQFHEHATDHLKQALKILNNPESGSGIAKPGTRIVVFVDDLDRCTPQNALEVLESIKAFFDIDGIVYVVGMDSDSINHIIKQKYGELQEIKGIDYLEKIVQLPFQIPVWKPQDITGSIEKIISWGLGDSELAKEFKEDSKKLLIVNAIEPNPRQVKRFINNIILAKSVFDKDIDKLIAVQALNFRRDWKRFLELITPDETRKTFFGDYYLPMKAKGKIISSKDALDSLIKEKSAANQALPSEIVAIFQEIIDQNETLMSFLNAGADGILLNIEMMEEYRRALEVTKLKESTKLKEDNEVVRVLFVPANPSDQLKLNINKEYRSIEDQILRVNSPKMFDLRLQYDITIAELQRTILRYRPRIIHFSGHSSNIGELVFANELGEAETVSAEVLAELFRTLNGAGLDIQCVLLNACYLEAQARAIAEHVDYVVGIKKNAEDNIGIPFAESFYSGLANNLSISTAVKFGKNSLLLSGYSSDNIIMLIKEGAGLDMQPLRQSGKL